MKWNFKTMSATEVSNRWSLIGWLICASLLSVAYGVKGFIVKNIHWAPAMIICLALIVPVIVGFIIFNKNHDTVVIRRLMPTTYGVALLFIMTTSRTPLTFLYCLPVLLLVVSFNSSKLMNLTVLVLWVESCIAYTYCKLVMKSWDITSDETLIYFIVLPIMCAYSCISTKLAETSVNTRLEEESKDKNRMKEIVDAANKTVANAILNIATVNTQIKDVSESSTGISYAMQETLSGMKSIQDVISVQVSEMEVISKKTESVLKDSVNISTAAENANSKFNLASEEMSSLTQITSDIKVTANNTVSDVSRLNEVINSVTGVVKIISGIAGQIKLLSLNASIEAARAGDTGKGFAVVADEIGKLAVQTDTATKDVYSMIDKLTKDFDVMRDSVNSFVKLSESQEASIDNVVAEFDVCRDMMKDILELVEEQKISMNDLALANTKVCDSTQELSAIEEETHANAISTEEVAKRNVTQLADVVSSTATMSGEINRLGDILK